MAKSSSPLKLSLPSLEDLLKKGVHFGHRESKWHPNMKDYIYTSRNGVHIIDLVKTSDQLKVALEFLKDVAAHNKQVMFVGTKKSVKEMVKKYATEAQVPYVSERWLGGTITNFESIHGLIKKLRAIEEKQAKSDYEEKYNKKERLDETVEKQRLEKLIGGIREIDRLPDVLFVIDIRSEKTAVQEAQRKGIPVVAIVDTNVDPTGIDWPIPANDDSVKSVDLILQLAAASVLEGVSEKKEEPEPQEEKPKKEEKAEESTDAKGKKSAKK